MKTLLILRHGEAEQGIPNHDIERALKKHGEQAAQAAGEEVRRQIQQMQPGTQLDLIISSAAHRAQQTAKQAAQTAGYDGPIEKLETLYLSGGPQHLEVLAGLNETCQNVLLVGHNPDLEDLVNRLRGEYVPLTTGALVGIALDTDSWRTMSAVPGTLRFVFFAKES